MSIFILHSHPSTLVPRLLHSTLTLQPLSTLSHFSSPAAEQGSPPSATLWLSCVTCDHGDPGLWLFDVRQEGVGEGDDHAVPAAHPHPPAQETACRHRLLRPHLHRQGGPQEQWVLYRSLLSARLTSMSSTYFLLRLLISSLQFILCVGNTTLLLRV